MAGYSSVNSGTVQDFSPCRARDGLRTSLYALLGRIDSYEHRAAFGLDYRAYKNSVIFGIWPVRGSGYHGPAASLTYQRGVSQVGGICPSTSPTRATFRVDLTAIRSLQWNAKRAGTAFIKPPARPGASAKYSVRRAGVAFSQLLLRISSVRAAANAQHPTNLLVPGEQFGMGGPTSVRGYYERETASDNGMRFSLEGYGPDFGTTIGSTWTARALIFIDRARGRDNTPARDLTTSSTARQRRHRPAREPGQSFAFRLDVARSPWMQASV